ncbi:MAG: choice-of-anchor B domain-containing protein [Flavobacteriaceae bacterium]|jgi:choice-of-anchor B domain-containing protein|uniref:choice-of-anchor B family protein n=1 Tax=Candidatus Marifrigoribacter sp. Uisw_064 TaxID=3230970 RepID=UPI003AE61376
MKNITLTILLFSYSFILAQTPCVGGMAGTYPCEGYDLLSHISFADLDATNANDSWGWIDPQDNKEYAIVGLDNGTAFIDISDPINPVYLGKLPTSTGSTIFRDIKTYNNYAFIVSDNNGPHGMQIFDLTRLRSVSNPPETFSEDAHYSGFNNAHNLVINETEGFAYAVRTNTFGGGIHFINIQDPLNPVAAGGFSGVYTHDAQVVTYSGPDPDYAGHEILISCNGYDEDVTIVDITDKANPQAITSFSYTNSNHAHQGWLTEDHRYFLLGDEADEANTGINTRTIIFDFEDLDNPTQLSEYFGPTAAIDHNGYVLGDSYYLANYAAGMRVIDISDIANGNLTESGSFDVYPPNNVASFNGAFTVYPYFESGNIMISALSYTDNNYPGGFYLVRDSSLGLNDNSLNTSISIYPNPVKNLLQIDIKDSVQITNIRVYDALGRLILLKEDQFSSVDVSKISTGLLFIKIETDQGSVTKKVVKE